MLFPLAPAKVAWDYIIMFLVAYNAVELPFSIAFDYEPCEVRFQLNLQNKAASPSAHFAKTGQTNQAYCPG